MVLCAPAWLCIAYQTKYVSPEFGVALRFLLAFAALEIYRAMRGEKRSPRPKSTYVLIFFQGLFLFSINYWLCYEANYYMATGLIAATVSTMIIPNLILGRIFLRKPICFHASVGALLGLIGVLLLFNKDFLNIGSGYGSLPGFFLAFGSTFLSATGTILTGKILARGVSVTYATSRAFLCGGVFSLIWSFIENGPTPIPLETDFILSLLYLGIIATTTGNILYARLIKEAGPGIASYLWIVMPAVSLVLSTFFEGYEWTTYSTVGIVFITAGGTFAISGKPLIEKLKKYIPTPLFRRP